MEGEPVSSGTVEPKLAVGLDLRQRGAVAFGEHFLKWIAHGAQKQIMDDHSQYKIVAAGRRFGKALSLDTPIPTPRGWTTMKQLRVGDYVYTENGKPTRIIAQSEVMEGRPCYRVAFSDGTSIIADAEHQWFVWSRAARKASGRAKHPQLQPEVLTTKELCPSLIVSRRDSKKEFNYRIPIATQLESPDVNLPVDPYVFGAWLGDGTSAFAYITVDEKEPFIIEEIYRMGYPIHKTSRPSVWAINDGIRSRYKNTLNTSLRLLGVLKNKHIPVEYLSAGTSQRLALLQGLMDTDGTASKRGDCTFDNMNMGLSKDVFKLVASLGMRPTLTTKNATIYGRFIGVCWRVHFTPDKPVFRLPRKLVRLNLSKPPKQRLMRSIVNIEPVQSELVQCIQVDNPTKLYLAGDACIPTHNSEMCSVDLLFFALANNNTKQFIISASQDQANIIFETLANFAYSTDYLRQRIDRVTRVPFPMIRFVNGSVIHARSTSYDGRYLRGYSAHRIVVDEMAYISDGVLDAVIKPMLADYNGSMILISTPRGRNDFFKMFEKGEKHATGFKSWRFPSEANPHISHAFVETQRETIPELAFRTEYLAEFIDDQLCVFKWEYINAAMSDIELSLEREDGHSYYMGVDIARTHDYTVISVLDATNPHSCELGYYERFNNKPYSYVVERVLALSANFMPFKILVDETGVGAGPTESICEMLPNAEGFHFSMPTKISLINTLRVGLEKGRIKFSRNFKQLEDELRYFQFELPKEPEKSLAIKMHAASGKLDDCVVSLALAFMPVSSGHFVTLEGVDKPIYEHKEIGSEPLADSVYPNVPSIWAKEDILQVI